MAFAQRIPTAPNTVDIEMCASIGIDCLAVLTIELIEMARRFHYHHTGWA